MHQRKMLIFKQQKKLEERERTVEQMETDLSKTQKKNNRQSFCKVNQVQFGSPAEAAGLKTGDLICQFGYADFDNHNNLRLIRDVVIANEDNPIDIVIERNSNTLELHLTPKKWKGNGLLGCHLVPV
mmetsp:Transcript_110243/g.164981  ORF Transcript_110243/g.164981 Transcript_110243/m.164981 type:complete len:127 (-) Transcript_110243:115-495(-)